MLDLEQPGTMKVYKRNRFLDEELDLDELEEVENLNINTNIF